MTTKPFPVRPWVSKVSYSKLSDMNTVHFDVFARNNPLAPYYFILDIRQAGHNLKGRSIYRYDNGLLIDVTRELGAIDEPELGSLVEWTERNHDTFKVAHPAILSLCKPFAGYTRASTLFHYVHVPDENPFPRTMRNAWTYGTMRAE